MKHLSTQFLFAAALCASASLQAQTAPAAPAPHGAQQATPQVARKPLPMQCYIGTTTATTRCPAVLSTQDVVRQAGRNALPLEGRLVSMAGMKLQPGVGPFPKSYAKDASVPVRVVCPAAAQPSSTTLKGMIVKTSEVGGMWVLEMNRCDG